ncbi:MAG: hypothetical protein CVU18_16770 [Betaproteobacteria bacterium HGW-Betaproteobacteria-12]|nr:MAG: hypothetical protein CVU18_16770 [Betaproteobacteria bacterium HGW-Betaproteobacteria-12]
MKVMALTAVLAATSVWADVHSTDAPTVASTYQSVFADYKPFQEEALHDWRRVNGEMGQLRGHRGHLQASQAELPPAHDHRKPVARPADERR